MKKQYEQSVLILHVKKQEKKKAKESHCNSI